MTDKTVTFRGILSAASGYMCLDVTEKDFTSLRGRPPNEFDRSRRYHGLYAYHPDYLFSEIDQDSDVLWDFEITVKTERTTEYAKPFKGYRRE